MTAWRVHGYHHEVQTIGRDKVFSDYRIRIAQVIHEERPGQTGLAAGAAHALQRPGAAAADLCAGGGIEAAPNFRCTTELAPRRLQQRLSRRQFRASDRRAGSAVRRRARPSICSTDPTTDYFRIVEVMRDYGMYDRTEAPQYYPPVEQGCLAVIAAMRTMSAEC